MSLAFFLFCFSVLKYLLSTKRRVMVQAQATALNKDYFVLKQYLRQKQKSFEILQYMLRGSISMVLVLAADFQ